MSSISAGKLNTNAMVHLGDRTGELVFKTNTNVTALTLDSAQKATFTGDVVVAGNLTINGTTTSFGDGDKLVLGDADDLQIFHDGSNSYVSDRGTGSLVLDTNGGLIELASTQTDKTMATFNKDGSVDLYHDNSIRLQTTAAGVDVNGSLVADSATITGAVSAGSASITNAITADSATITSGLTAAGLTYPTSDGTDGQAILTDGSGNLTFGAAGISTGKAIAMAIVFG